jgi:hypothetical protein
MPLPELDDLLRSVEADTGLDDWADADDPGFKSRVGNMLEAVKQVDLDSDHEKATEETFRWHLTNRLRFFNDRAQYPIADEVVERPLIVIGEPRAGTTLLHALLGEDQGSRSVRFWELYYPSPPPGLGGRSVEERKARADADWRDILRTIPKWLISHPYNDLLGQGLAECERLASGIDFTGTAPSGWWRVPAIGLSAGTTPGPIRMYKIHKMTLQHLQFRAGPRRWALKGTSHHQRLVPLLEAYPDGCFIWIHRDPVVTTASFLELISQIQEGITGRSVDRLEAGAGHVTNMRAKVQGMLSEDAVHDPRILHIPYHEFVADHVATVHKAYEHFGIDFTSQYGERLRWWLGNNRPDRYGKFTYSVENLGVDIEELYEDFTPYMDRFGVRRELKK